MGIDEFSPKRWQVIAWSILTETMMCAASFQPGQTIGRWQKNFKAPSGGVYYVRPGVGNEGQMTNNNTNIV